MRKILISAVFAGSIASPLISGHGNPWATEDDVLQMQYHAANLVQSVGTPGEDEMRGTKVQTARGKLDDGVGAGASGGSEGDERGKGK